MKRIRLICTLLAALVATPALAAPTVACREQAATPCLSLATTPISTSDTRRQQFIKLLLIMHAVAQRAR